MALVASVTGRLEVLQAGGLAGPLASAQEEAPCSGQ